MSARARKIIEEILISHNCQRKRAPKVTEEILWALRTDEELKDDFGDLPQADRVLDRLAD